MASAMQQINPAAILLLNGDERFRFVNPGKIKHKQNKGEHYGQLI